MAIWQFKLMLLPKPWASANKDRITRYLLDDGWELNEAWQDYVELNKSEDVIDQFWPRSKSWYEDLTIWGDEKADDIQLWREDDKITNLQIRIDTRKEWSPIVQTSIKIARELNCQMLVMEVATIIEPTEILVLRHLKKSTAARFAADPYGTLEGLQPIRPPKYIPKEK